MAKRAKKAKRTKKVALPAIVIILIVLAGFFVELPPEIIALLPPDIAELLPQYDDGPQMSEVDAALLPKTTKTFETAKDWLYEKVYFDHRTTFYCGCDYSEDNQINLKGCGLTALSNDSRAQRVEAEHVFSAYDLGRQRLCWQEPESICGADEKSRDCCQKTDPVFNAAHNDLYNLYPAVGYVNGKRSNYRWGTVEGEPRQFGDCNFELDESIRRAEPPENVMGDIARTYFYMARTYGMRISDQQLKLFIAWNNLDVPDEWEHERNRRIADLQGRSNPYIDQYQRMIAD